VPNTELIDLDPATVLDVKLDKMRKTLQAAHHLAAEQHPLSYYKEVLQNYQEELIQQEKAKAAKAATPKGKKSKAVSEEDEDVEMEDAVAEGDETPIKDKKAKKRKAEDSAEVPLPDRSLEMAKASC
jgi:siderophore synthetase component